MLAAVMGSKTLTETAGLPEVIRLLQLSFRELHLQALRTPPANIVILTKHPVITTQVPVVMRGQNQTVQVQRVRLVTIHTPLLSMGVVTQKQGLEMSQYTFISRLIDG